MVYHRQQPGDDLTVRSTFRARREATDLAATRHVCAFTLSSSEHERGITSLVRERQRSGEKTFVIVNRAVAAGWAGLEERRGTGRFSGSLQVEILDWTETYLAPGRFEPDAMLLTVERLLDRGAAEGYDIVRIVGDVGWAAGGVEGAEFFLDYEARLDILLSARTAEVFCFYNLGEFSQAVADALTTGDARLDANFLVDVLHVHPAMIVHGEVFANPVYQGAAAAPDGLTAGRTANR